MIPDWLWATMAGGVVTAAGFWCKSIVISLSKIQETLSESQETLAKVGAQMTSLHNRVDRVEEFIDKIAERRFKG